MRKCGDCQLCCKLVPVKEIGKLADTRCHHQKVGHGCDVYRKPGFPFSCLSWNCAWIVGRPETRDMRRPDRAHYVLDTTMSYVRQTDNVTGEVTEWPALQVWCDRDYPDAWRDPALLNFIEAKAMPAIIRYDSRAGLTVVPPSLTDNGQWLEVHNTNNNTLPERVILDEADALAQIARMLT